MTGSLMKKVMKLALSLVGAAFFVVLPSNQVAAHPGNTASDGAHFCWTNCASWGEVYGQRHYHGGYSEPEYEYEYEPEYDEPVYDEPDYDDSEPTYDDSEEADLFATPAETADATKVAAAESADYSWLWYLGGLAAFFGFYWWEERG